MTVQTWRALRLALREGLARPPYFDRIPETAEMNSPENVLSFHAEGAVCLLPAYHFNARAISALAPRGASILDLGCGSGQFLAYLATRRPDLRLTGLDIAGNMLRVGREALARVGLDERVRLIEGNMMEFRKAVPGNIDLISSIFALHHLTSRADLAACLSEIARDPASWASLDFRSCSPAATAHGGGISRNFYTRRQSCIPAGLSQLALRFLELRRASERVALCAAEELALRASKASTALPDSLVGRTMPRA